MNFRTSITKSENSSLFVLVREKEIGEQ